jgi:kynurenine 3-monooxygenase
VIELMAVSSEEQLGGKGGTAVAVVGGGLVGSLQALFLAKSGLSVDLYERRKDIRTVEHAEGRSINLALSVRGREALREVGLEGVVLDQALPMYGRMIHSLSGKLSPQAYGRKDQCIYSVDRLRLNKLLLSHAEDNPNVTLHFQHQLVRGDLVEKKLTFHRQSGTEGGSEEIKVEKDFVFGCDGAFSSVRRQMMRWGKLDYCQEYIDHGYKELTMPADNGEYAMSEKFLHIWPRGEFMMIALPNQNKTFTLTLFMPFKVFESIDTVEDLLAFFMKHFQDSVPKIGVNKLAYDYFNNPTGSLVSVKCKPHFMADSVVIMGDAAHAVVPFYGQGMNAGFEDCLIFYEHLSKHENNLVQAAQEYSDTHWQDCHTIADLSMYNYVEMRHHVNSWQFLFRKYVDTVLHFIFPGFFIPLYSMVSFSRIPYHQVVVRNNWQKKLVDTGLFALKLWMVGVVLAGLYRWSGIHTPLRYRIIPCVLHCVVEDFFD